MPAMLVILSKWLELAPDLIELGLGVAETYDRITDVWAKHRVPGDPDLGCLQNAPGRRQGAFARYG